MRTAAGKAQVVDMARRLIQLRWQGRCCVCLAELAAGDDAVYDEVAREVTCSACATGAVRAQVAAHQRPARPTRKAREDERIRSLIAEARAKLDAARKAS